jgi:hypothetical protein
MVVPSITLYLGSIGVGCGLVAFEVTPVMEIDQTAARDFLGITFLQNVSTTSTTLVPL